MKRKREKTRDERIIAKLLHDLDAQIVGDLKARKSLCEQSDRYKKERDEWRDAARRLKELVERSCGCETCNKA